MAITIYFHDRNEHLMSKGMLNMKTTKTGTTIVGLTYKVRSNWNDCINLSIFNGVGWYCFGC